MTEPKPLPINLRVGLWGLVAFTAFGLLLEALHGFKVRFYLDVDNETRRLLFRLAHAHGVLLGVLNVGYALVARTFPRLRDALAGRLLCSALLLMPSGFLLGGAFARAGDPGIGVALAAVGGVALFFSLLRLALKAR